MGRSVLLPPPLPPGRKCWNGGGMKKMDRWKEEDGWKKEDGWMERG